MYVSVRPCTSQPGWCSTFDIARFSAVKNIGECLYSIHVFMYVRKYIRTPHHRTTTNNLVFNPRPRFPLSSNTHGTGVVFTTIRAPEIRTSRDDRSRSLARRFWLIYTSVCTHNGKHFGRERVCVTGGLGRASSLSLRSYYAGIVSGTYYL